MAGGADGAADALFKRYARAGSGGSPGVYRVRVLGIHGADDYLRLAGYLDGVSIVRKIVPVSASPDTLELDVELTTGVASFSKYVDRGSVLASVPDTGTDSNSNAATATTFRLGGS